MTTLAPPTAREERLAEARELAGCRQAHYARENGALVVVLGPEAGLDDDPELPWWTVCLDHDRLVGHPTLALARSHAADPEGWCGVCAGTEDPDKED